MTVSSVAGSVGGALLAAGQGPAAAHAPRLRALALRSRHDTVVDALALRAGSPVPAATLARRLADGGPVPVTMTAPGSVPATLALATSLGGMQRGDHELHAAVDLFETVLDRCGPGALGAADQRHLVQAAFLAGRHALVERALGVLDRLTDAVVSGLRADLANPVLGGPGARPHAQWEQLFGARFVTRELVPPAVDPDHGCLFDGLHLAASRSVDGPLVTVVVPSYRPDAGLITSVRSVLAQSHGHLEVLLVDDRSGPGHEEMFARAEALDQRVRLIRLERNGGSYLARNTALAQARGALVTTQDADDWSHPERIAAQVELMARHPGALASRSAAIRCRPDLTRQWFGYSPERMNASALMVRREVLEDLGGYDQIRKGADSEMYERLTLLGDVVDVAAPLAVTRLAAGSLSRADFSLGRHSPDRVLFRSAFRHWHQGLRQAPGASGPGPDIPDATGQEPAGLDRFAGRREGQRPYPVPRSFLRDLPHAGTLRTAYPLVLLADLADPFPAAMDPGVRTLVTRASSAPVAVLGRENLLRGGEATPAWSPLLLEAAREGLVDLLTDTDEAHAGTLLVLEPSLLAPPVLPLPRLRADHVVLVAVPPGPDEPPRDLEVARATARELCGPPPVWAARSLADQQAWSQEGWALPLLTEVRPLQDQSPR